MFCGGSLTENNGRKLGRTILANWVADKSFEMENTLGRMWGSRFVSFI